jgi:hypothetical protein
MKSSLANDIVRERRRARRDAKEEAKAPLCCVGCGNPADFDGSTNCECSTGILSAGVGSEQFWSPATYTSNIAECRKKIEEYREGMQEVMNEIVRRLTS